MKSKLIVGSVMSLAALAVAIDHTKHSLPEPVAATQDYIVLEENAASPCGLNTSPCGLTNESPCGLNSSPCGL